VRPVSLSHFRPSVRRALSCAGPYGAKRGMCRGLSHPRLSCSFYRVPSSRPAVKLHKPATNHSKPADRSCEFAERGTLNID
jgi:hypothetical protein